MGREMSEGPPPPYWEKSDQGAQGPAGPPGYQQQGTANGFQNPGYGPPPLATIPMQAPTVILFGPEPMATVCPNCRAQIITATEEETGCRLGLRCSALRLWLRAVRLDPSLHGQSKGRDPPVPKLHGH